MKIFDIKKVKLFNDWSVESIKISKPYAGLLEGSPYSPFVQEQFFKTIREITKNKSGYGEQALNHIPRSIENEKGKLLKSFKIEIDLTSSSYEKHTKIITYLNEKEELEDVLNEILLNSELVIGESVD